MKAIVTIFLILSISLSALSDDNVSDESSYIDKIYEVFDAKVHEWSVSIDGAILEIYEFFGNDDCSVVSRFNASEYIVDINSSEAGICSTDAVKNTGTNADTNNQSLFKQPSLEEILTSTVADEFFLTRKLLEERDKSHVRVSYLQSFNSLEDGNSKLYIRARLKLNRSKKHLRLYIEDFKDNTANNIGQPSADKSTSIGLELLSKEKLGIKSKYKLGFRGFDPYLRARYSYKIGFGRWNLEPVQTFTYSLRDEFSEITELYLDTRTSENTLLRFVADRGTKSRVKGMHYDGFVQWFYTPRKHRGLNFNLGFNGSTKYQNILVSSTPSVIKSENRVFNYMFSARWRENILKKWLFYEIGPGVNYHEAHGYRPNYNIYFKLDLFFGHV